jgi:hypothetical protein
VCQSAVKTGGRIREKKEKETDGEVTESREVDE